MTAPTPESGKSSTGLDQNVAAALAYLGGVITGIIFYIIEKDSRFVKFHAMQSIITFAVVFILHFVFLVVPIIGWVLYPLFLIGVLILWLFLMFKAFNGQMYKLPIVGDLAEKQLK
jgi:uncharacterized membrane protein